MENVARDVPPLLEGAPWATVAIRLGSLTSAWVWNSAGGSERVTPETIVRWASLAKPATALVVLRLVALGRLGLDDPATWHSRSFVPTAGQLAGHPADSITLRHLLTHTSGMGVLRYPAIPWDATRPTAHDLLASDRPPTAWTLAHAPGAGLTYGSAAFIWLQSIVEDVMGQAFERVARSLVLEPMGLSSVAFLGDGPAPGSIAWGVDDRGTPITPRRSPAPAATGLFATPTDIVRLMGGLSTSDAALLDLLGTDLVAQSIHNHTPALPEAWGLGWRLQDSADGPVFRHAGWPDGITAYVEGLPRLGLTTALLIGRAGAKRALVRIADIARWHARG